MVFVTADRNRTRLEELTKLLVGAFPGSTIYQHADPLRAPKDALSNKGAIVFLEEEADESGGIALMQLLHRQDPGLPVFILSRTEHLRDRAAAAGAAGYLLHPLNEQALKAAVLSLNKRENVS